MHFGTGAGKAAEQELCGSLTLSQVWVGKGWKFVSSLRRHPRLTEHGRSSERQLAAAGHLLLGSTGLLAWR